MIIFQVRKKIHKYFNSFQKNLTTFLSKICTSTIYFLSDRFIYIGLQLCQRRLSLIAHMTQVSHGVTKMR